MKPTVNVNPQRIELGTPEHDNLNHLGALLKTLLDRAYELGFVVTVHNRTLANGDQRMFGNVAKDRKNG